MDEREEKYVKLRKQLEEGFDWPSLYMFKFIIPADNEKLAKIESLFNSNEAVINTRQSRKGNFISVTVKEMMMDPQRVIDRYLQAEDIGGVIAL